MPEDLEHYEQALAALRCRRRRRAAAAAQVRVLMTGVPMAHGAERVLEIIEHSGGLVVCMESCTGREADAGRRDAGRGRPAPRPGRALLPPPLPVMTPNDRRLETLRQLVESYRPQCVVELIWQACLTYDVESYRIRRLAEEELGLPYLRIETDYSPSDSARIALRVEALLETVRGRPA